MLDIRCVGVGASQRIPLSVLARNPHNGLAREISHGTGRGRGKEGPRAELWSWQNKSVSRREQVLGLWTQTPGWPMWEDKSWWLHDPIYKPLRSGRIWHKVNFFWIHSFPSPRLVASARLKNLVCPTIYP